jgi:hypothetical protein
MLDRETVLLCGMAHCTVNRARHEYGARHTTNVQAKPRQGIAEVARGTGAAIDTSFKSCR